MEVRNSSVTKDECEEFLMLEKELSPEQKRVVLQIMNEIILEEPPDVGIEKKRA